MKKTVLFFLLVATSSTSLFSQYRHYNSDETVMDYGSNFYRWGLYQSAVSNQNITIVGKNKKGKTTSVKTNHFNEDTLVTNYEYKDGKGKDKIKNVSIYEAKKLISREVYKKGSLKYKVNNSYEGKYKTSFTKTDAKGIVLAKNENTFTAKDYVTIFLNSSNHTYKGKKLTSSISYKKGGEKQKNKWMYEYNDEGERTVTTFYNAQNKLKYTWDYGCKTEGDLVVKKQANYCKWQESEDGMLIEVTRKTSPKGKIQKTIKKYDADTNLVAQETYLDDVISQKVSYDKVFSKPLQWENFKKGKLKRKYSYKYAANGKVLNTKSFKGKDASRVVYEEKYTYKNEQLIAVENHNKGKLIRSYVISYN